MAIYKDHKQQELLVFYSISEAAQNQFFFSIYTLKIILLYFYQMFNKNVTLILLLLLK